MGYQKVRDDCVYKDHVSWKEFYLKGTSREGV